MSMVVKPRNLVPTELNDFTVYSMYSRVVTVVCNEAGRELNLATGVCQDCPVGYYRDPNLHTACVPCHDNWVTTAGSLATSSSDCIRESPSL